MKIVFEAQQSLDAYVRSWNCLKYFNNVLNKKIKEKIEKIFLPVKKNF
jgi:hypothetical protein